MGQHIVADPLGIAQPAAVADHQPGLGPQHCQVIADRLGIGRADPDVDQGDPQTIVADQVIGWHLMPPPGRVRQLGAGIVGRRVEIEPARAGQRDIAFLAQLLAGPVNKLIDIAVIVGEQHELLEMFDRGPGVVRQPGQAEIGAQPVEQRQRDRVFGAGKLDPVGQLIADQREFGGRKVLGQFLRTDCAEPRAGVDHIGERDFLGRGGNLDLDLVIVGQHLELFGEVAGEQRRAGDGGGEAAGPAEPSERTLVVRPGFDPMVVDPQLRITPGTAFAAGRGRELAVGREGGDV